MPRGTVRGTTDPARHPERTRMRRGRPLTGEHATVVALLGGNKLESSTSDSCPGEALQLDLFCCRLILKHVGRNGIIIIYLSVSIEMDGVNVVAAYDNWDAAIDVYRANFQHPVFKRDLSDVSVSEEVAGFAPDIIIGGPPCQDFSQAGKRSEDGGRAILSVRYAEIIARCKPRFIVMENVPRVRTSKSMEAIRATLKAQGYGLSGRVMDASLCGVPQARKRYFLIGCLGAPDGFLDPYLEKGLSDHQMTIREYLGNELQNSAKLHEAGHLQHRRALGHYSWCGQADTAELQASPQRRGGPQSSPVLDSKGTQ